MAVYVAEIAGRGIAAMNASAEAEEWFCGEQFKADLSCFDDKDGNPLWDGEQEIYVREALPEEYAKWQASRSLAARRGEVNDDDEPWLHFLVPVIEG
jgi:hypothetical protein